MLSRDLKSNILIARRYFKIFFQKNRFVPASVPRLSVETTNFCDSRCGFCANMVMKRKRQHLDMDLFKKAVDEFAGFGGRVIDFNTVIGEPLLDPYLLERARYVRQFPQFKSLGFVTNLQWLHKFQAGPFIDSGITWLGVSAILSGREKYMDFFGVDRYDIFLKNLLMLIDEKKKGKNTIYIYIDIKPTGEPNERVINNPDFKLVNSLIEQDLVKQAYSRRPYVDDWSDSVKLLPYLKRRPLYPRIFRPCSLLYSSLIVYSNGKIGSCSCRDFEADSELVLGDLRDMTIEEAWKGEKLAKIRSDWKRRSKVPDICKRCRHYLY